jgi:Ca-activated chloride channel family protein
LKSGENLSAALHKKNNAKEACNMNKFGYYVLTCLLFLSGNTQANEESPPAMIVLDTSNSMWGEVDNVDKINHAKDSIKQLLKTWPESHAIGIMGFAGKKKSECRQIKMLYPLSPLDLEKTQQAIEDVMPKGHSPIHYSLEKAQSILEETNGGSILLVSDGTETCEEVVLCDIVKKIPSSIQINTLFLGKDSSNSQPAKSMQCIADSTGGKFYTQETIKDLSATALLKEKAATIDLAKNTDKPVGHLILSSSETDKQQYALPATYLIYNENDQYLGRYPAESTLTLKLPVGSYQVIAVYDPINQKKTLDIEADAINQYNFVLGKTHEIGITALHKNDPVTAHFSIFDKHGKLLKAKLTKKTFTQRLPLGRYKLNVVFNDKEQEIDLEVSQDVNNHYWLVF